MNLLISSKEHNSVTLELKQGKMAVDAVDFAFDKNLDTELIKSIDKFLKRNKIDILSISKVEVASGIDETSSMYKVLRACQHAIRYAQKASK